MPLTITPDTCQALIALARQAGAAIMAIYRPGEHLDVHTKDDQSPLTQADLAAHQLLHSGLPTLLELPLLSEESQLPAWEARRLWSSYWLIDPLDGTKEFIAGNGEFTVNIALVVDGRPLLGLVHLPVSDETYLGVDARICQAGKTIAEKYQQGKKCQDLRVQLAQPRFNAQAPLRLLVSHRHASDAEQALVQRLAAIWPGEIDYLRAGSSLKFCRLAQGDADIYPRYAPTSEWDTAAAQAVLEAAGGGVINAQTGLALRYNQTDSVLNPSFVALADSQFPWPSWRS